MPEEMGTLLPENSSEIDSAACCLTEATILPAALYSVRPVMFGVVIVTRALVAAIDIACFDTGCAERRTAEANWAKVLTVLRSVVQPMPTIL